MNYMKKTLFLRLPAYLTVLLASTAYAVPTDPPKLVTNVQQIVNILNYAVKWIYTAFFIITVIYILLAAYKFLRGGDNPKNVEDAKKSLTYAVIAIVVALLATGISVIIQTFLSNGAQG
jgi:cytochrome bd-type quinol oxidase subunit 1